MGGGSAAVEKPRCKADKDAQGHRKFPPDTNPIIEIVSNYNA